MTREELKQRIIEIVNNNQGIKGVDLCTHCLSP